MQSVSFKTNSWYRDSWTIKTKYMSGHNISPLTREEIDAKIKNPIGSKPLSEITKGRRSAVIVFSDLTRGDDPKAVLPSLLKELHEGGIQDDDITFIAGLGAHGTMTRIDWAKKLGEDIVSKYRVFNHNVYDHNEEVGTTSRGTLVEMNREYLNADIKVAIGGIIAHTFAGFGGGGKGVFPAVASINSIVANHRMVAIERPKGRCGYGILKGNVVRMDMEEAARLSGLDFKVDMVYNVDREPLGIFAGDFIEGHKQGVKFAKQVLTTVPEEEMDVVVANSYPGEAGKATWATNASLKEGGTAVIIHNYTQGSVHHNIYGQFGRDYGGPMGRVPDPSKPSSPVRKAGRVIYVGQWHSKRDMNPSTIWVKTWSEALEILRRNHNANTKIAVYPYCALQMPPFPSHY